MTVAKLFGRNYLFVMLERIGKPLVIVSSEVSGTLRVFEIRKVKD